MPHIFATYFQYIRDKKAFLKNKMKLTYFMIIAFIYSIDYVSANELMKRGFLNKIVGGVSIYHKGALKEWADSSNIQVILDKSAKIAQCPSNEGENKSSENELMICGMRGEVYGKYNAYLTTLKKYADQVKPLFPSKKTRFPSKLQKNAKKLNNKIQDDYKKIQTKMKNAAMFFANFDSTLGTKKSDSKLKISTGMFSSVKIKDIQMYAYYLTLKTKRVNVYIGSLGSGVEAVAEAPINETAGAEDSSEFE